MFEKLKKKIAHFFIRRRYLRENAQQLAFANIISDAHDFFIVMPKDDKDFYHSMDILKYFQIHRKVITLFLPENKYNLVPEKEKYKFISFVPEQLTKLNLPDKNLASRLSTKEFDVVLDLNRGEDSFFSAVSNIVKSKLRVSFEKEFSEKYYTMQIQGKHDNPEQTYCNFLSYLKMF